jgi:ribosomal protein S18 acetylase RimI-like enzyme
LPREDNDPFKSIVVLEYGFRLDLVQATTGGLLSGRSAAQGGPRRGRRSAAAGATVQVRPVRRADLPEVIALDATVTGLHKADYWQRVYRRYGISGQGLRHFLVAAEGAHVIGFVIGEVRDWEFGSPPCGWVFAIDVDPRARQKGVGTQLLAAVRERFARVGVRVLRTMLARDNPLILSFFRSQGMTAGRLIPLEVEIGAAV